MTGSRLPTHKNLKERIAAFQRLNQQYNSPSTSPNPNETHSPPDPSLTATHSSSNANNNTNGSLRDKIARFEAAGGIPIPRGSFGMGAMPLNDDDISRRKGEMLGNRVPGLNRPKVLPTEGLGMASKSHLTVKPVAKDPAHHHSRGESQSLGNHHRRYTSQSHSTLTSPSLSAYDGESGVGLLEVDEFGGLNGLGSPQTPYSAHSPASTFSSLPSPEVSSTDKLPGRVTIPDKFQRRVVSDFQASYGFTRASTPDPEMLLQPLEEEVPLSSSSCDSRSRQEAEPNTDPQIHDDPKEPEVQLPIEQTPELQIPTPEVDLPPPPVDSSREVATENSPEATPIHVPVVDAVDEGDEVEDVQRSSNTIPSAQDQDHTPEVPKSNPISVPLSNVTDSADVSPSSSPKASRPSTPIQMAGTPPVIVKEEKPSEPVEEVAPSVEPTRDSDDAPTPDETPAPANLVFPLPTIKASLVENPSTQLQTPPESPKPASFVSTTASDLSDSTIDYQNGTTHPDPYYDLFVLPLPKDDELPPRPIVQEVAMPHSMYQVLAPPLSTLQEPIEFPITTTGSVPTESSLPNVGSVGDESLALDASQAEIMIAQSELIRAASPTLLVAMPSPPPTATTFRMQTPPPPEEPLPLPDEVDNNQTTPPRIRKKLYANNSVPTSFKDTLSPPPTRQSFSAVVHQKTRTSTFVLPPDRDVPPAARPSNPLNAFMTPKKKQSLFTEFMTPASPGSELASLVKSAAILEAQLQHKVDSSGDDESDPVQQSPPLPTEPPPRSTLRLEMTKAKSASTPTLASTSMTTSGHIPPVPDLVYDTGSSNSVLSWNPQIPPFLPLSRSRKSGAHEEADRKSLAPSHKSRKSEKSAKEKDKDSLPRARKLSSRLRSLASSSTNSLRSLGRPSVSSDTSVSFDSPTTVSVELMTPQHTGNGENGRLGVGIGSPGSRSQTSQGSGSEWNSPPRRRDVLGRASSFADRFLTRGGKTKSGFLDNSQGNVPNRHRPSIGS